MSFVKTAYDIARKKCFFCNRDDNLSTISEILHKNNVGSILVKDRETVVGIITVNDMLRQMSANRDIKTTTAGEIMSAPVKMVNKDMEIDELADEFNRHKVSRMVLLDDNGEVVGIVRDIAVYKYFTFFKYDADIRRRFGSDYIERFY